MDIALSLMVLAAVALVGGAVYLWRRGGASRQVWLMLVMAAVMVANVVIWTIPVEGSAAASGRAAETR